MTRKDFQELAEILAMTRTELQDETISNKVIFENLRDDIIAFCKRSNPNFDRTRFVEAIEKAAK